MCYWSIAILWCLVSVDLQECTLYFLLVKLNRISHHVSCIYLPNHSEKLPRILIEDELFSICISFLSCTYLCTWQHAVNLCCQRIIMYLSVNLLLINWNIISPYVLCTYLPNLLEKISTLLSSKMNCFYC